MAFINIIPRDGEYIADHTYVMDEPIPLRVVQDDGIKMTPDINIKVTDLSKGLKNYTDASGKSDRFVFTILVHKDDSFTGTWTQRFNPSYSTGPGGKVIVTDHFDWPTSLKVVDLLEWIIRNMVIISVTSDNNAAILPDGRYIITENRNRTQNYKDGYSLWELEFTMYQDIPSLNFEEVSAGAKKAANARKKKKEAAKKKKEEQAKEAEALNAKLKKCKVSSMKYSKKKKTNSCIKYLQKWLNKHKFGNLKIDGWYGDSTLKAVKKFQNKYKKKYKLTANGKMTKATKTAMLKVK